MQAVFERRGERRRRAARQRRDQQGRPLHVEDRVLPRVAVGQNGPGVSRRQHEVRHNQPTPKLLASSSRTARATPPASIALATIEPSTHAATLSGWPSIRAASSRIRRGFHLRPSTWSAMTTPAVSAAALEPRPLPSGISLRISSSIGGIARRTSEATRSAVCQIRFSSPSGWPPHRAPMP